VQLSYQDSELLPTGIEIVLFDFIETSYEALENLQEPELLPYFDMRPEASKKNAYINQLALSYLVEVRKDHELDLRLVDYNCVVDVIHVEETGLGVWEIGLREHSRVNYAFIPEVDTYASGVEHELVMEYIGGSWKITFHSKEEDVYYLAEDALDDGDKSEDQETETMADVSWESRYEEIRGSLIEYAGVSVARNEKARREFLLDPGSAGNAGLEWDFDYDRQAAVDYAFDWVGQNEWLRNPEWIAYDSRGGNCNNFISQCLMAGGIPMDAQGHISSQWKWIEDYVSSRESLTGRSASWAGVDEFHEYAMINQGYGLVAIVDQNIYSGRIGDIIQYGSRGGWNHSVIIVNVIRDEQGRIVDYLINSNTTDRIDCPMSAYSYTDIRLIKILGYNGEDEELEEEIQDPSEQ
jgi:hypothetical protein